jgi:hypothetical protein
VRVVTKHRDLLARYVVMTLMVVLIMPVFSLIPKMIVLCAPSWYILCCSY